MIMSASQPAQTQPTRSNAALVLSDGTVFWARGVGAKGENVGEVCFNTSLTGYQEVLTDPSYAGQIITFTFPHIGNVGVNTEDLESNVLAARGLIMKADISEPANWRSGQHLDAWLVARNLTGISGVDTRQLTRRIAKLGAPVGVVVYPENGVVDVETAVAKANAWPGLEGMDLAKDVTCSQTYHWDQTPWTLADGFSTEQAPKHKVVAVDYGAKWNILRCLAGQGCDVTVVSASATAEEILAHNPDGIFLSNGPGDPAATGVYAVPTVKSLIETGTPIFGICLGHQILALALGAKTEKMHQGHRGANHPVKDFETGMVEITSQNHGFCVDEKSLPEGVEVTHRSLFDGTNEGIRLKGKPVFSVQYHPEASPGPQDSHYLFERFVDNIEAAKAA
jgi:carbamoyl-phosphate synthase small subunit